MAAESSLPLRMMPTWRHMRSRICVRAEAVAEGASGCSSAAVEIAALVFAESEDADPDIFTERVDDDETAAVSFAECTAVEREEFDEVCAAAASVKCASGFGAGLPGRADALCFTAFAPFAFAITG